MGAVASLVSYDTFGFAVELLFAAAFLMLREPRRTAFAARALAACALTLGAALLGAALLHDGYLNLLRYGIVFASVVMGLGMCFDLSAQEALFFGLAAYNVQHMGWRVAGLLTFYTDLQSGGFYVTLVTVPLMLVVAVVFSRTLQASRDAAVNNGQLLALVSVVIVADLVLNYVPILMYGQTAMWSVTENAYAIICCLLTLAIQSGILARSRLEREQALLQELWRSKREQYELTKHSVDIINARSHDLKKQLGMLLALSRDDARTSGAIREIQESIEAYDNKAKTGNRALDVLLTQKLMQAQTQQTTLAYLIDGAEFGFLDEVDLYALFGNVLDNALEAAARIEDTSRRIINLRAVRRGRLLVLHCENYLGEELVMGADGLPRTSKEDRHAHGFGLRSIKMVVEKYHGHMKTRSDDGTFHVQIVIPQPQGTAG